MLQAEISDFTQAQSQIVEGTQILICDQRGNPIVIVTEVSVGAGFIISDYRSADFAERLKMIDRIPPENITRIRQAELEKLVR